MTIGEGTRFEGDPDIQVNSFSIGKYGYIGPGVKIRGNNVTIGDHFYCSGGLNVGGGGSQGPNADLTIGDRCTLHNNFINVCEEVYIGHDVGLSHGVSILTHGYWMNALEGYPFKFQGLRIYDKVILGYNALVLPGCSIDEGAVIGAGAVVTKPLGKGIWGGNPARFIRYVEEPSEGEKRELFKMIMGKCQEAGLEVSFMYPEVGIDAFWINVLNGDFTGVETKASDKLRDILRHYGIRIYTSRPFG